jgi:subtilisin family serine protease
MGRISVTHRRRSATFGLAGVIVTAVLAAGGVAYAEPREGHVQGLGVTNAVRDSFIVVLRDRTADDAQVRATATELTATHGGRVKKVFSRAVQGFSARMTSLQAKRLAASADVAYVEQDRRMTKAGTQVNPPSWGLDRIDQSALPVDRSYNFPATADNVHAYVIDSGIRIDHQDFGGRASYGYDFVDNDADASDCNGHGTHVAGTIGGSRYGVAKDARLVAVRVLNCDGSGTAEGIVAGIDWVTRNAVKPAVANMSIGGARIQAVDTAVRASIASGVTYAVAAGNENQDACTRTPAAVAEAITVGATDETDFRASFSNYGNCVDLFAPGVNITSAWMSGDSAEGTLSGTSMASPHVAGAAALVLSENPDWTPQQVRDSIVNGATRVAVHNRLPGSPDRLLRVGSPAPASTSLGLLARANGRYVTADNYGDTALIANRVVIGAWETFDQIDAGSGYVALRARANSRYVTAGSGPLIASSASIGTAEKFEIIDNADGTVSLRALANGRYVTAENGGGSPLIANRDSIGPWEEFDRIAARPSVINMQAEANNLAVSAENAGASPLIADRGSVGQWESFDQFDLGDGYVALRAHANGMWVTAESGGGSPLIANRTGVGPWEKFRIFHNSDGSISVRANANGKVVAAENAGASPLIANRDQVGQWESFYRYAS